MPGSITDTTSLNNGVLIPLLGFGVWRIPEGAESEQSVRWALEIGYRHIDTAALYANEKNVGDAIAASGIPRERIFVTTKAWNDAIRKGYDGVLRVFDESLAKLRFDYVDLYLLHWPINAETNKEAWRAMERIYSEKRARAIGVSNYTVEQLQELLASASVRPAMNQVEFHPRLMQPELMKFCRENKIVETAWAPLLKGKVNDIPELQAIAKKYGKKPTQVTLRWEIQHGVVTIPKSVHRERIAENADIFDFELTPDDMAAIDKLNTGERIGAHPGNVTW